MTRRGEVEARLESDIDPVNKMMAAFALDAADHAAAQGVDLDFSEASIETVETILDRLATDRPRGIGKLFRKGPSQQDIETVCKLYGGYLGEVMRLEWGVGEWVIPGDGPFANALVFKYGESLASPPSKVLKRIVDGPEDHVGYYYHVLKSGLQEDRA